MTELLIASAMALVFWLGYVRGHNAGVMECKRQYFERIYLRGLAELWRPDFGKSANFDHAGRKFVEEDRDGR